MKHWWFAAGSYIRYLLKAKTRYVVHSPFVYDFTEHVLEKGKISTSELNELDRLRRSVFQRKTILETTDLGAGAGKQEYRTLFKPLGRIARKRTLERKYLYLLYNLAGYYQPKTVLEFGTALGISTMYIAKACNFSKFVTLEGCAVLASHAEDLFDRAGVSGIKTGIGPFDVMLDKVLDEFEQLDLVFFDGNHRKQATIDYFEKCLPKSHENTVFIFDDIRWSPEMEEAWKYIIRNEKVTISIDLFKLGILFFKKGREKQDFVIRY